MMASETISVCVVILMFDECYAFQIIDANQHALSTEVLDDSIEVKNSNHWGIKFNKQTGLIESWKVPIISWCNIWNMLICY